MSYNPLATRAQQAMPTLQHRLEIMTDSELVVFHVSCLEAFLLSGEEMRLDPDQDPGDINDPDSEFPSAEEMVCLDILDMTKLELERRAILKASL